MFGKPSTPVVVVTLPPLRSWWVIRLSPAIEVARAKVETVTVTAHTLSVETNGALVFVTYIIVDNTLVPQFTRGLREWIDFGVVEPVAVEPVVGA